MAFTLVADLYESLDETATDFAVDNIGNLLTVATPIVGLALTLSLLVQGLFMMTTPQGEPLSDLLGRFIKYAIVLSIAGAGGFYQSELAALALNFPDELSSNIYIGGSSVNADSMGAVIDSAVTKGALLAKDSFDNIELSGEGFASLYVSVHILICTFVLCGVGAALILMAKFLLALVVAFGPVFIFCLMFDTTKRLFTPWIGSLVNYILVTVLVSAVFSIMVTFYSNIIESARTNDNVSFVSMVLSSGIIVVITTLVLFKIPSLCAAWSNGIAASFDLHRGYGGMGGMGGRGRVGGGGGGVPTPGTGGGAAPATPKGGTAQPAASKLGGAVTNTAQKVLRFARK